jgi:molybdopterin/thiamine biosynthesis adenylyltransferase
VSPDAANSCTARILDPDAEEDLAVLGELRSDPAIEFVDHFDGQVESLQRLRPAPESAMINETHRWVYCPWRRAVVKILGPQAFRAVRLDRNRNMITLDEQGVLGELRVGVIGLSVGHAIAYTLAAQGLCGELRLADFDSLELTNLNRVPATVFDLGVNKAVATARRIGELDPYLPVQVLTSGLTPQTLDRFLDGLDVVVEECDSLDMKLLLREAARERRLPVLMATSDRGLVDVERFDLDPTRPVFHGLIGEAEAAMLTGLTNKQKVPHVLRILDGAALTSRVAASLVEIGHTVSTWPQVAAEVAVGGAAIAEAVRRIGLGEKLPSGRVRVDIAQALDRLADTTAPVGHTSGFEEAEETCEPVEPWEIVTAAAIRAPSGGNVQPWHIEARPDSVVIRVDPEHTSAMDVAFRGSAVAVGAAAYNGKVAAAAHGFLGPVEIEEGGARSPLRAVLRFGDAGDRDLARLYRPMLLRETNRHRGTTTAVEHEVIVSLTSAAAHEGCRVRFLTTRSEIEEAATILGAADRIRYLTPRLHVEMFGELRWPEEGLPDWGIDVRSLGLDDAELVTLDILRRPEVMAHLAQWGAGAALADDTRERVCASSALAVISVKGRALRDYARGGSAAESVWITAQQHGLRVQPISPVFLYAQGHQEFRELSTSFASALDSLQSRFRQLAGTEPDESQVLALRVFDGPDTSVPSRRSRCRIRSLVE